MVNKKRKSHRELIAVKRHLKPNMAAVFAVFAAHKLMGGWGNLGNWRLTYQKQLMLSAIASIEIPGTIWYNSQC